MPPPTIQEVFRQALQLHQAGRNTQAEQLYRQILTANPQHVETLYYLGILYFDAGHLAPAVDCFKQAISANPNFPQAYFCLANAHLKRSDTTAAIEACNNAIALKPSYPEAFGTLADALRKSGDLDGSIPAYQKAIALTTANEIAIARYYCGWSIAMKDKGQIPASLELMEKSLRHNPNSPKDHGNLLFTSLFDEAFDAKENLRKCRQWNDTFAAPLASQIKPHLQTRVPDRRLRIGYVSADFRMHAVGRFLLPLFKHHDRTQYEIFCYSDVIHPDEYTRHMQSCVDVWRHTYTLSDAQLAEGIRNDQIDLLIDLSMHIDGSRLLAFARKPAPIQMTYLAYPGTTGLAAMDYRISDNFIDPPGSDDTVYSEKTLRLPHCYWCYAPLPTTPAVNLLPALSNGFITFGCFNNYCKVSPSALAAWARLLAAVPNSRLVLGSPEGSHRQQALEIFAVAGVVGERIEFRAKIPLADYFSLYHQVDIGLDPFPYAGGTTTCDALYMGVPVITLAGQTSIARSGVSILSSLHEEGWIGSSVEDYIAIGVRLASDVPALASIRTELRARMRVSPLMDASGFARGIERLYRSAWEKFCEAGSA